MHKELTTIQIIRHYLESNNQIKPHIKSIREMYDQFSNIMNKTNKNIRKFNSLYILNYIKLYIANEDVAK